MFGAADEVGVLEDGQSLGELADGHVQDVGGPLVQLEQGPRAAGTHAGKIG